MLVRPPSVKPNKAIGDFALNITRRNFAIGGLSLLAGTSLSTMARAEFGEGLRDLGEGIEDFAIAQDAYIFGYPLVTMEFTRRIMTNVAAPAGTRGPMGQFIKAREYPDAKFRDVTAPNADTLYTTAWVDVGKEPWVLSIPDMKDRYFLFPMLDGWTNVFQAPGKRTTGTGRADLRDHRAGLERNASSRRQGIQVADQPGLDSWPHLLHGNAGRLRRGSCRAGSMQAGAAELLRQAVSRRRPARSILPST